jgi:hypothetical protein
VRFTAFVPYGMVLFNAPKSVLVSQNKLPCFLCVLELVYIFNTDITYKFLETNKTFLLKMASDVGVSFIRSDYI